MILSNDRRDTSAVLMHSPGDVRVDRVGLRALGDGDVLVRVTHSGISSGTERMLWDGTMPAFPGLSYPLVPGYEAVGIIERSEDEDLRVGQAVFVPGAQCHEGAAGLFGASSQYLAAPGERVVPVDTEWEAEATLLALAATAYHAVTRASEAPDLIVGHGVLGRLIARVSIALGNPAPTVWERSVSRRKADGYHVVAEGDDDRHDYTSIIDASGDNTVLDRLIARCTKGGEVVLAGFYGAPISFAFPVAFMREATIRVSAEFTSIDTAAAVELVRSGKLSLSGLLTHAMPFTEAANAYATAFGDPECLKMILDWSDAR